MQNEEVAEESVEPFIDEDGVEVVDPEESEGEAEPAEAETTDEIVVSIGDEPEEKEEDEAAAKPWVRDLRKNYRDIKKENRDLRAQLEAVKTPPAQDAKLGPKPTLADHEYDEDAFSEAVLAWNEKKRAVESEASKKKEAEEQQKKDWDQRLEAYNTGKTELRVSDFDEAESVVLELFSVTQQGIATAMADNPSLLIYAIGKNPKKAQELAAISDPIKFTKALTLLESKMSVTPKKAPAPEATVKPSGASRLSGGDAKLDALRAKAAKTGDFTDVVAYKNRKKA